MTDLAELIAAVGVVVMLVALPVFAIIIFFFFVGYLIKGRLDNVARGSLFDMMRGTFEPAGNQSRKTAAEHLGTLIEKTSLTSAEEVEWEQITQSLREEER